MRILGVDPGIARVGWGVIEVKSSKLRVEGYDCFETSSKEEEHERLRQIHSFLQETIQKYQPSVLAVERLFFNTNTTTAFTVGQARGVILLAAAEQGIPIMSYTPLEVKMAVTGYGRADKPQIGQMVKMILSLPSIPKPDDTADALAIAITHAFSYKVRELQ